MPFIILGIIIFIAGGYFVRWGIKHENKEILIGAIALVVAAIILVLIFGLFYRGATLFSA